MPALVGTDTADSAFRLQLLNLFLDGSIRDAQGLSKGGNRDRRIPLHELDNFLGTFLGTFLLRTFLRTFLRLLQGELWRAVEGCPKKGIGGKCRLAESSSDHGRS